MLIKFFRDNYFFGRNYVILQEVCGKLMLTYEGGEDKEWHCELIETIGI